MPLSKIFQGISLIFGFNFLQVKVFPLTVVLVRYGFGAKVKKIEKETKYQHKASWYYVWAA